MNVLKNLFINQGNDLETQGQDQEPITNRPLNSSIPGKHETLNEGSTTPRASAIQIPDSNRPNLQNLGGLSLDKPLPSSRVLPITVYKGNSTATSNFESLTKEKVGKRRQRKNLSSMEVAASKSNERPKINHSRSLRRANTLRISTFNPKDYEETFEESSKQHKPMVMRRARVSSANSAQVVNFERKSSASSSSASSLNSLSKGSSEISNSFTEPRNHLMNDEQERGSKSFGSISEQKKRQSLKIERRQSRKQSKKSSYIDGQSLQLDEDNEEGIKGSLHNDEGAEYHRSDSNIGFYEDVDFANRSDDEYSVYSQKAGVKRTTTWRLRMDPGYRKLKYILLPDDPLKVAWDIIIIFLLVYTTIVFPLRLAFIDDSAPVWGILDWTLDGLFLIDIIVNIFSAYFDEDLNLVTSRKKILKTYLRGWFLVDFCAIIPFDVIIGSQNSYQQLIRVVRLSRLYKLLRMLKLVRMFKLIRERATFMRYINRFFRMSPQMERLVISFIIILVFVHVCSCLWKFLLDFNVDQPNNWLKVYAFYDSDGNPITTEGEIYIASAYMIVQTVVTVGYGDLSGYTTDERIACCIWIFVGVFAYSFTIGSLASLISSVDKHQMRFRRKLNILLQLKKEFKFSNRLYLKIKHALRYGIRQAQDNLEFLKDLPQNISQDLSCIIHKDIIDAIPFFMDKPRSFIAAIGPLFRPMKVHKGEYIFLEGDPADEIFFLKRGQVAYVIQKYYNFKFLKVKEGYYFGEIDLLFYGEIRKYTVQAVKTCELYVLNKKDFKQLFLMEFRDIGLEFADLALSRKIRTKKTYKEALDFLTKGGVKIDSAHLQHKVTAFEDRFLKIEEEYGSDAESDDGEQQNNLLPRTKSELDHINREELAKIEQLEKNHSNILGKAAPNTENKKLSSRFLEASLFSPILGKFLSDGEASPTKRILHHRSFKADSLRLESTPWTDNQQKPASKVSEINQKVTNIQDKVNNLLEMSIKLQGNSEVFSPFNKIFKKSETSGNKPDNTPLKKMPVRNSISYSPSEGFLDFLKHAGDRISPMKTTLSVKNDETMISRVLTDKGIKDSGTQINNESKSESGSSESEAKEESEEPEAPMLKDLLRIRNAPSLSAQKDSLNQIGPSNS